LPAAMDHGPSYENTVCTFPNRLISDGRICQIICSLQFDIVVDVCRGGRRQGSWRGFLRCKKIMLAEKKTYKSSISQLGRAVGVPYPLGRSLLMIWKTCQPVGVVVIYVGAVILHHKVSSGLCRHFFFFAEAMWHFEQVVLIIEMTKPNTSVHQWKAN
jgi:hypothetical protein